MTPVRLLLLLALLGGCDNDLGLPGPRVDGGGDGTSTPSPDLAPLYDPCAPLLASPNEVEWMSFGGAGGLPFVLGGDGTRRPDGTMSRDAHVAIDGSGRVVLGQSGGLPEPKGSFLFSLNVNCHGPCTLRRIGWTVETPPNTWVNVATRVGQFDSLDGGGFIPRGDVSWVDLSEVGSSLDVQWDVELFSGSNDAGSPKLRGLYACWKY